MRVADLIFHRLKSEVDVVFYLPGGMCATLVDALGQSGIKAVSCPHEQGAGYAAVAYAQYHGFGVALSTSGPGATNMMTPCLAAWMDSVPVLFLSGTVANKWTAFDGMRSRGTQEGKTIDMATPITKNAICLTGYYVKYISDTVDLLIETAKEGRQGPVWLEIPQDVQAVTV